MNPYVRIRDWQPLQPATLDPPVAALGSAGYVSAAVLSRVVPDALGARGLCARRFPVFSLTLVHLH